MNATEAIVSAQNVTRRYGQGDTAVDALRGVSLDIERGKLTAIMGPSGSGKSTLMHILAGLDKPSSGTVQIAGKEITSMGDNQLTLLRREHIGFVFQFFNLLPMLTARENIMLPLTVAGKEPEASWFEELITKVGLKDRLQHLGRSRSPLVEHDRTVGQIQDAVSDRRCAGIVGDHHDRLAVGVA